MFEKIDALRSEVDQRRPLSADLMKIVAQKFREEWTYHTNAIEGNTFSYQETAFFLREGLTVKGKSLREHLEIINHAEAIDYLQEVITTRDLTERLIKDFHALLFQGVRDIDFAPGEYKKHDNHVLTISGKIHHYTPAIQVPIEMEQLMLWYESNKTIIHPIQIAATFHHKLVAIHPFTDGNARVSRLAMNFILMKNGFPPAIIRNENREDYYAALEKADNGDLSLIIDLVAAEVKNNLDLMLSAL
ncbi:Fic family protein [Paenibacillus glucanolyticus]|uniref:Cell filamentation protein Fic n=1 Tax=Paenibacillus glucanolyticus TaxID=59843 RepID=A0A163GKM0_9BACL|nr:Fic family protein [Paenibacillus glucanolyticus]KZS45022.1 cell filamentation protein Fic [Paenibacillus glucanolyticus]OMF66741.1 cell filamentation protein Fic [Paenibacillus glucanolyticus]